MTVAAGTWENADEYRRLQDGVDAEPVTGR